MFPLRDENPTVRPPVLTVGFIIACTVVFLLEVSAGPAGMQRIIVGYGLIPGQLLGTDDAMAPYTRLPAFVTVFTSMFLHGGWMHLIGNMLFRWIFGNNIEDELGHGRFLVFYLLSGVGAALAQVVATPDPNVPMVGASGAISGILGAYMILYPRARVLTLIFLGFFITTARIGALWFLGFWFLFQAFSAFADPGTGGGVAWWAHIGGFIAGIILLPFLRPRRRAMFGSRRSGPWG